GARGQPGAEGAPGGGGKGPRRIPHPRCRERRPIHAYAAHPSTRGGDGLHAPGHEPYALLARALEHVHAELLAAEPAAASPVEERDRVLGEVWKVFPDERAIRDHVDAGGLIVEALRRRRPIVAGRARVDARRSRAERRGLVGGFDEPRGARWIGAGEQIAAAIHAEDVAALARQLLEQVDRAVHRGHQRVPGTGPEIPVALRGLVAGERQRRAAPRPPRHPSPPPPPP